MTHFFKSGKDVSKQNFSTLLSVFSPCCSSLFCHPGTGTDRPFYRPSAPPNTHRVCSPLPPLLQPPLLLRSGRSLTPPLILCFYTALVPPMSHAPRCLHPFFFSRGKLRSMREDRSWAAPALALF